MDEEKRIRQGELRGAIDEVTSMLFGEQASVESEDRKDEATLSSEVRRICEHAERTLGSALANPDSWQLRKMRHLHDILTLLSASFKPEDIQGWFVFPSEYLGGYTPRDMLARDPMSVRQAALDLTMQHG